APHDRPAGAGSRAVDGVGQGLAALDAGARARTAATGSGPGRHRAAARLRLHQHPRVVAGGRGGAAAPRRRARPPRADRPSAPAPPSLVTVMVSAGLALICALLFATAAVVEHRVANDATVE